MRKKIISMLLAAAMFAAILPQTAFAASFNLIDTVQPYMRSSDSGVVLYPSTGANSVQMAGVSYKNAFTLNSASAISTYAHFNLGGQYATFSGLYGAQDGTTGGESYTLGVNFYGDGQLLAGYQVESAGLPNSFSLNVTGVSDLKIEVVSPYGGNVRDYPVVFADLLMTDFAAAPAAVLPAAIPDQNTAPAVQPVAGAVLPLIDTMLPYAVSSERGVVLYPSTGAESVSVAGAAYKNAFTIDSTTGISSYAHFNFDGQYGMFTGVFGAQDGETMEGSYTLALNFYGDGVLLANYTVNPTGLPQNFAVNAAGVGDLKIEVVSPYGGNVRDYPVALAALAITELSGPRLTPQAKAGGTALIDTFQPTAVSSEWAAELYPTTGVNSASIAGQAYKNALTIDSVTGLSASANFNIGGAYYNLDMIIGALDGETMEGSYTLMANFYGDGRLLGGMEVKPQGLPKTFSVNVAGVSDLKIEVVSPYGGNVRDYNVVFADMRLDAPLQ